VPLVYELCIAFTQPDVRSGNGPRGRRRRPARSPGAPIAQLLTKRLLNEGLQSTLEQAVNHEAMAQVDNLGSADAAEARDAFLQRRPATFTGGWPGR